MLLNNVAAAPSPHFRRPWWTPIGWRALVLYALVVAVLIALIARGSAGFSYSLDDPYIHLALAQHIAHGTYGINAGETTSPASSVLWPFLLVPFADSAIRAWAPLVLNLIAGAALCLLLGNFVERFYGSRLRSGPARWSLASLLVLAGNLGGLTLLGMEHTTQVLLCAGCAYGIAESYFGRRFPAWSLACAALAPSLRYEDLALTLAVCLACWLQGRRLAGVVVGALSLIPLLAMGLFLHAHGLAPLPNSVIVKGGVISARTHLLPGAPLLDHFLTIVAVNARAYLLVWDRWPLTLLLAMLFAQTWYARRQAAKRNALLSGLIGLVVIMAVGPYGYFFRYDVAYRLFAFLLVFAVCTQHRWFGNLHAQALALLAGFVYVAALLQTPAAASAIAHEQKQMQVFSQNFYGQNVAVNDLGWVSFDSRDEFYILDLAGLASNEASRQRVKDAAWLDAIVQRHNVGLAMIYPYWFASIPADWTQVALLQRTGTGPSAVTFYATQIGDERRIRDELKSFAPSLPSGSTLVFSPER